MRTGRRRVFLFVLLCVAALGSVVSYAVYSERRSQSLAAPTPPAPRAPGQTIAELSRQPHLLFRSTELGPSYGRIAMLPLDAPETARLVTPLSCDRVYGSAKVGIGLQASRGVFTTYKAVGFDSGFQVHQSYRLAGAPSRTRVSRDGRMAATTVFVTGDSYNSGGFSTRTTIIDLVSSNIVGDLEGFAVLRNGQAFKKVDFNFWGVTFDADPDHFYATLASGGVIHLVEGRVSRREMRVLREGVECPSLSPDGSRLAFKSRTREGGRFHWKLRVMSLKTGEESVVNESRSVDDQAEWYDDDHVLYSLPRNASGLGTSDVWIARADGTGTSRVLIHDASSPCVVRP